MKKLFSIFTLVLLLVAEVIGQAAYDIQIMVHDYVGASYPIWFGLDLEATDGIDSVLGESNLPPYGGGFDARWLIPPFAGLSSRRDYRAPGNPPYFPFYGNKYHRISFLTEYFPITISWNLPNSILHTSFIRDLGGGGIINKVFAGIDSVVVIHPFPYLEISIDYWNARPIVPVELTSFTASVLQNEKAVQLNWITATETNNLGFEILRFAQNDNEWEEIGFVPGFGTTTEPNSYSFLDENVTTGTFKYRLKQIDFDGSFEYSNEIDVVVDFTPKEFMLFQNYPNPFNPSTVIEFSLAEDVTNVKLSVYNTLGEKVAELVNSKLAAGKYQIEWNASNVATGMYIYVLRTENFATIKKMLLIK